MTHSSRKRLRPCADDDGCEFTPISKRINNIHIRSNQSDASYNHMIDTASSPSYSQNPCESSLLTNENSCDSLTGVVNVKNNDAMYNPSLTIDQNPNYYGINKVLFEAHLRRNCRINKDARDS